LGINVFDKYDQCQLEKQIRIYSGYNKDDTEVKECMVHLLGSLDPNHICVSLSGKYDKLLNANLLNSLFQLKKIHK